MLLVFLAGYFFFVTRSKNTSVYLQDSKLQVFDESFDFIYPDLLEMCIRDRVMSGDDTDRKSKLKGWIINILIGGLLVFGAATLAEIIKTFVGGTA